MPLLFPSFWFLSLGVPTRLRLFALRVQTCLNHALRSSPLIPGIILPRILLRHSSRPPHWESSAGPLRARLSGPSGTRWQSDQPYRSRRFPRVGCCVSDTRRSSPSCLKVPDPAAWRNERSTKSRRSSTCCGTTGCRRAPRSCVFAHEKKPMGSLCTCRSDRAPSASRDQKCSAQSREGPGETGEIGEVAS